tara:strand:- start:449 stop:907 length:459 start_codon:yes stop_codon:yes gene_type:complete
MTSHNKNETMEDILDVKYKGKEIQVTPDKKPISLAKERDFEDDYKEVRGNLKHLVSTGEAAIDGIMKVATEGDHPRAYEVVSQLIKTVSDVNKDLVDLHKKSKEIKKEDNKYIQKNTTNNAFYVGSTSDLQDIVNASRSRSKVIENDDTERS